MKFITVLSALTLCGVPTLGWGSVRHSGYDISLPAYAVAYTEAQKAAQLDAGRNIVKRFHTAVAAGAHQFTVPAGTYRLPASGDANLFNLSGVQGFTLNLAHTEFILGNGGSLIYIDGAQGVKVLGPTQVDGAIITCTQGRLLTYDATTGLTTLKIMPGYEVADSAGATVDAFSPQGVYLENPSWNSYKGMKVRDRAERLVQVDLGKGDLVQKLYRPGVLLAFRLHGSPLLISARNAHGFTVKDVDVYTESGIAWGGGTGDWNFIRVRGIRRPGTSRLMGAGGCQVGNYGGNVTFDGCEFSNTADDLMDYGGGGLFMTVRTESPRQILTWGGSCGVGDTINFYTHGDFHAIGSAKVVSVTDVTDAALQAEAHAVCKDVNKGRDTGNARPLRRVTFDRDVQAAAGDFVENDTSGRPNHFTVRNCDFHDSGVRVMVQGFRHGLFEHNRFTRISGGLCLTCDAWWWEGPTVQDVTVRGNVFQDTTFRNAWGTGAAAVTIAAGRGPSDPGRGVAIHTVSVVGNTILDSSNAAVAISNAAGVAVRDNVIRHPFTQGPPLGAIQLTSVDHAQVWGNTVAGCPGVNILALHTHHLSIKSNIFQISYKTRAHSPKNTPDALIGIMGCADTQVVGNRAEKMRASE